MGTLARTINFNGRKVMPSIFKKTDPGNDWHIVFDDGMMILRSFNIDEFPTIPREGDYVVLGDSKLYGDSELKVARVTYDRESKKIKVKVRSRG